MRSDTHLLSVGYSSVIHWTVAVDWVHQSQCSTRWHTGCGILDLGWSSHTRRVVITEVCRCEHATSVVVIMDVRQRTRCSCARSSWISQVWVSTQYVCGWPEVELQPYWWTASMLLVCEIRQGCMCLGAYSFEDCKTEFLFRAITWRVSIETVQQLRTLQRVCTLQQVSTVQSETSWRLHWRTWLQQWLNDIHVVSLIWAGHGHVVVTWVHRCILPKSPVCA